LVYQIDSGAFGEIFFAINKKTGKEVAAKLEKTTTKNP